MKSTTFMQIAFLVAQESKCCSWKVGTVIVKDDRIIATGYNGTPSGQDNCCDVAIENDWVEHSKKGLVFKSIKARADHSAWSKKNEIHAELNAILFAARTGIGALEGATMYVTASPCSECCKAITQSGIKTVVFSEEYDQNDGTWADILIKAGISVFKIDPSKLTNLRWEEIKTGPVFKE